MEQIIWVIHTDRLEMIEAQRRINSTGSMRALCLLSKEAVEKAVRSQEQGQPSRLSTPSLVVLDYETQQQENFASLSLLQKYPSLSGVPIFFMVAQRSEALDVECYAKGATVVVHKPFSEAGLLRMERTAWQHEATKNYEKMLQKQAVDIQASKEIMRLNQQLESRNRLLHQIFGRYFSDSVVEDILENPQGAVIGGEKRNLTVMMADLRGFTAMTEQMAPETVADLLNCFFDNMSQCIAKYHGVVIEFLGDAILVVFGAFPAEVNPVEEGIAAGIEMQNAMEKVNEYSYKLGYTALEMGIGLHCGEVFIGNVGSEKMMRYNVVGTVVNECSRIEGISEGGQVLVSQEMLARSQVPMTIKDTRLLHAKGISQPLKVSKIIEIGSPYNCRLAQKTADKDIPAKMDCIVTCKLTVIEDKMLTDQMMQGEMTHYSEKRAWVRYENTHQSYMSLYSDVKLQLCGKGAPSQGVYAKIIQVEEGRILLHFTYTSASFGEYLMHKRGSDNGTK